MRAGGRKALLSNPVKDIELAEIKSFRELLNAYKDAGGFMASNVGYALDVLYEMVFNEEYTTLLSFPAALIATGLRGVIREMVKRKWIDVIITTCGTLDHDIARSFKDYYAGSFFMDDKQLKRMKIHRLGNVLVPYEHYGPLIEAKVGEALSELYAANKEPSTYELSWFIGSKLNESSILHWAHRNKIPVVIPGPYDGAVGAQIWIFQQTHKDFKINLYRDEELLSGAIYEAKRLGGIMIGGGISKHHLLWWAQYKGGLDLALQITTAVELDGSLSGARLTEAITWSKVSPKGREVTIWGEATIILPILIKALLETAK